jgi:cysteine desulfurase
MGLLGDEARGSLRFSLGRFNTEAEVDLALKIVPEVIAKLRALSPAVAN